MFYTLVTDTVTAFLLRIPGFNTRYLRCSLAWETVATAASFVFSLSPAPSQRGLFSKGSNIRGGRTDPILYIHSVSFASLLRPLEIWRHFSKNNDRETISSTAWQDLRQLRYLIHYDYMEFIILLMAHHPRKYLWRYILDVWEISRC